MSNKAFIEAEQRAQQREAERAAKKDRAQQRAQKIADTSSASSPIPVQPEEIQAQPRTCLCHKAEHRPHESFGCCKKQTDSIRWVGRVAADTDLDDVARVQELIDSGKIKRAATKAELLQRKEHGTAAALKDVANANGKP